MDKEFAKSFYSREDIQKAILDFAKNREIGTRYDGYFGKRPDVIENLYDIKKLVKNGIFSFHMSEEIWENPLLLGNQKLTDKEKIKNRNGWDLILDLDGVDYVFAGLKHVLAFLFYQRYIMEIDAQDTFIGHMINDNVNASHVGFAQKKNMGMEMKRIAEDHWSDCKHFVCENSDEFPYAKFTSSGRMSFM